MSYIDPFGGPQAMPRRDYFIPGYDGIGTLKYRADPNEIIRGCMDALEGIERDRYGRVVAKTQPLMNEQGLFRVKSYLVGHITKVTHLTWYENEERINRQIKHYLRGTIYMIVRNRKDWGIDSQNRHLIVNILEKNLHESMLKSHKGFEAEITGKSWSVSENINAPDQNPQQVPPSGILSFFKRGN